jgi:glycosyltransferase involved in cell wall biosynthesis
LALVDAEGGRVNRPVDDLITAYADRVVELALRERPAVLHAASNYINGLAAVHAGRRLGIPSIYEVRGFWHITRASADYAYADSEDFRLSERMELDAIREADRVISISSAIKQYLVERNVAAEKIFVVPNGADVESFKPLARDRNLARHLGIADESLVIGYVGSLVDYEGLDLLIEAFAKLRPVVHQSVRLLIVGAGTAEAHLKALAKEREVEELCVFPGRVPRDDVQRYYSLIDIAPFPRKLLPVTSLVPPLKPLEAMAMGKPILLANIPVLTELGREGESVFHFKHGDADALAQALISLSQSPHLRKRIGEAGRDWVVRERSLSAIEQLLEKAYRS